MSLVGELFEGALDIVGDVHGEIAALTRLLDQLGYDSHGNHADGRRLVFLGDLTDRGPDSPAVLEHVARLVDTGRAQCIAGNHELNLMRGEKKHGNDWWVSPDSPGHLPAVATTGDASATCRRPMPTSLVPTCSRASRRIIGWDGGETSTAWTSASAGVPSSGFTARQSTCASLRRCESPSGRSGTTVANDGPSGRLGHR